MHAIWQLLLDNEFMDAYQNGVLIVFPDGISRRVFPCLSIYSADYPEKYVYSSHKDTIGTILIYLTGFCSHALSTLVNIHVPAASLKNPTSVNWAQKLTFGIVET